MALKISGIRLDKQHERPYLTDVTNWYQSESYLVSLGQVSLAKPAYLSRPTDGRNFRRISTL